MSFPFLFFFFFKILNQTIHTPPFHQKKKRKKNKTWKDFAITTPAAEGISYFSAQTWGRESYCCFIFLFFFVFFCFLFRTGDTTGVDGYVRMAESREKNYEPRQEKEKEIVFFPLLFLKDCMWIFFLVKKQKRKHIWQCSHGRGNIINKNSTKVYIYI